MSEDQPNPSPGTLPEAENVTNEGEFCHLAETSVTSIKMRENNALDEACHRSIYTHSDVVTSEKNGGKPRRSQVGGTVSPHEATVTDSEWRRDCLKLSATKLKERYPGTYQAFHAMMYVRAKPIAKGGEGAIIHDSVNTLAKFMRALGGPRRGEDMTVDRLDYLDPEYAADKIVWADKTEQARNRSTNSLVVNPRTNAWATVAEVAEQLGEKANTVSRALNRAIEKDPSREAEIRRTFVAKRLTKRPGNDPSTAPATPEEATTTAPAYAKRTQPHDWKARWPVDMPKDQRDQWEKSFKEGRKVINDETGELEWRYEFYIRTIRGWLAVAGFGGSLLVGYARSPDGTALEKMRNSWRDPENPTARQLAEYGELEDIYDRMFARLREAIAMLPEFEAKATLRRRERDKTYSRYGRNRFSRDYEDDAVKDTEAFGHIDDDEAAEEGAQNADDWQREYAAEKLRERIERRRGIAL